MKLLSTEVLKPMRQLCGRNNFTADESNLETREKGTEGGFGPLLIFPSTVTKPISIFSHPKIVDLLSELPNTKPFFKLPKRKL